METWSKDWPKVREYVKAGNKYFKVDRQRKNYPRPKGKTSQTYKRLKNLPPRWVEMFPKTDCSAVLLLESIHGLTHGQSKSQFTTKTIEDAIEISLAVFENEFKITESPFMTE